MSECRRIVTCEIYDIENNLLSKGQNIAHCDGKCTNPPGKHNGVCHAEHAEIVAISRLKKTDKPCKAVINWPPCDKCSAALFAVGIMNVIVKRFKN